MIPYGKQLIEGDDIQAVVDVLRSDFLTQGPKVAEFEEAFAARVGAKHAVAVNSGTAALHACMVALRIGPGDEVIVPPITFTATANCVMFVGGTPVFADVLPSGHIDPAQIEQKVTNKTKAVIAVDYAGWSCDYGRILEFCEKNDLALICDACHALGATWNGRPVGSIGKLNSFSFHPVKHIATGEGGMVTTDDATLADRMREFRTHGITKDASRFKGLGAEDRGQRSEDRGQGSEDRGQRSEVRGQEMEELDPEPRTPNPEHPSSQSPNLPIPQSTNNPIPQSSNQPINQSTTTSLREAGPWHYEMHSLGYNYRMSDINCALGLSQLNKLDRFVARRREIAKIYYDELSDVPHLILPVSDLNPASKTTVYSLQSTVLSAHSFHLYPVHINFAALGKTRTEVMAELRAGGVGTQVHYIPVCLQPFYREKLGLKPGDYASAEHFFAGELSLPMFPGMTDAEVKTVVEVMRSVMMPACIEQKNAK